MKNLKKIFISLFLMLCFVMSGVMAACAKPADSSSAEAAELVSISLTTNPKVEYLVGEALDLTGGELTATYSDQTKKTVPLTDPAVTVQRPNMNTTGEKTVSIIYQSKPTSYKIKVSEPKLSVIFNLNNATSDTVIKQVDSGETVIEADAPVWEGHTFLGWYDAQDGSSKFNFDAAITAETNVYAHWGFTFKYDYNYAGTEAKTEIVEDGGVAEEPTEPSRDGFLFDGWYKDVDKAQAYNFTAPVTQNTVIYAGWTEVTVDIFTVTFVLNDGTETTRTKQVADGTTVTAIDAPTLSGAKFEGWYSDEELTTPFDFTAPVTANKTVYAKWTITSYSATYHYNHENNSSVYKVVENIIPNTRTSAPETPVLTGYYFAGWYTDAECTTPYLFDTRVNSYVHMYAKWLREWEFQAEYTDFGEREAFGYSANGTGAASFINKNLAELWGAHNGYWVANLHNQGLFVEFIIESDREVFDAAIVLRLSADFYDISLNKDNFEIKVNNNVIDYIDTIELTGAFGPDEGGVVNKRPFTNHEFVTGVHLVEGKNVIRFTMLDNKKYGEVGTINATAPMFDSMYLNTNATLTWEPLLGNV